MDLHFEPVWFDSLGAKSSCILVKTPNVSLIVDPGIAEMQPGYPLDKKEKMKLQEKGKRAILRALKKASLVIISHYHHDHYIYEDVSAYKGKTLFMKNPNVFINLNQRKRAEDFFLKLRESLNLEERDFVKGKERSQIFDPREHIKLALSRDFGDYNKRRSELFEKGYQWFEELVKFWDGLEEIREVDADSIKVVFPEGKIYKFGETVLRFTEPLFHGVEFSRLGWVFATVIEYGGKKLIHTSDLNGPIIEDYTEWIIRENPDILILDGPPTYLLGYILNKTNLQRAVDNMLNILRNTKTEIIIYDHHLPREVKFRERTKPIWEEAEKSGIKVLTAAEYLGRRPLVLEISS